MGARNQTGRLVWALSCAVVFVAFAALVYTEGRSPYSFLDRFHPKRHKISLQQVLNPAVVARLRNQVFPRLTVPEFDARDHDAVLAAMKRELT
ncbi:MAG TPA: hypothetical protein VG820_07950 [Fimbriimonadaceae bacterium]|nr:hypothetical protein [Fimbriimonadaceae bacterium]